MTIEVTFRTLKGTVFKLQVDEKETILELKRKVAAHQNAEDFAAYRLIHKGKILQNDATVSNSSITTAGFVVVMPPKKVVAKLKKTTASSAGPSTTPETANPQTSSPSKKDTESQATPSDPKTAEQSTKSDVKMDDTSQADTTEPRNTSNAGESSSAASTLVTGSAFEDSVKRICEMGFPEEQVLKAMRAAFNNPDRAVEFLFNGIPDIPEVTNPIGGSATNTVSSTAATTGSQGDISPTSNSAASEQAAAQGTPFDMFASPDPSGSGEVTNASQMGAGSGTAARSGNLDFLRNLPHFGQIRRLVQANPAALPQIIQQLSAIHPDLIALIEANQEEFSRLINEPLTDGEGISDESMEQLAQAFTAGGGMSGNEGGLPGGPGGGQTQVYVTPEERDQIDRLVELASSIGLAHGQVLETWLACNRDETLTANFLFDHAEELRADRAEGQGGNNESNNASRNEQGDPDVSPDRPPP